jgi:hypothetical protein
MTNWRLLRRNSTAIFNNYLLVQKIKTQVRHFRDQKGTWTAAWTGFGWCNYGRSQQILFSWLAFTTSSPEETFVHNSRSSHQRVLCCEAFEISDRCRIPYSHQLWRYLIVIFSVQSREGWESKPFKTFGNFWKRSVKWPVRFIELPARFRNWEERLRRCIELDGEYVDWDNVKMRKISFIYSVVIPILICFRIPYITRHLCVFSGDSPLLRARLFPRTPQWFHVARTWVRVQWPDCWFRSTIGVKKVITPLRFAA